MKPDWDELGDEYEKSKKVLIGDVDCTVETNKQLCEDQGIEGYPTLKYYTPGDRAGSVYEGSRDLKDLKAFVKTLGPACGPAYLKRCNETQRAELDGYMAMPAEELQAKHDEVTAKIKEAEEAHQELLKSLQAQYEASDKALKALKDENAASVKLMAATLEHAKAAAAAPAAEAPPKEEV